MASCATGSRFLVTLRVVPPAGDDPPDTLPPPVLQTLAGRPSSTTSMGILPPCARNPSSTAYLTPHGSPPPLVATPTPSLGISRSRRLSRPPKDRPSTHLFPVRSSVTPISHDRES